MSARQNPNDFLKTLLGRPVVVKLNSGVDYRGVLSCLDGELAWQTLAHWQWRIKLFSASLQVT